MLLLHCTHMYFMSRVQWEEDRLRMRALSSTQITDLATLLSSK